METWWKELLNFGIAGIGLIALALFILKILKDHKTERIEWNAEKQKQLETLEKINDKSSEAIDNNTKVLFEIKGLIASLKK